MQFFKGLSQSRYTIVNIGSHDKVMTDKWYNLDRRKCLERDVRSEIAAFVVNAAGR